MQKRKGNKTEHKILYKCKKRICIITYNFLQAQIYFKLQLAFSVNNSRKMTERIQHEDDLECDRLFVLGTNPNRTISGQRYV